MKSTILTISAAVLILFSGSCGGSSKERMKKFAGEIDINLLPCNQLSTDYRYFANIDGEPEIKIPFNSEFGSSWDLRVTMFHEGMAGISCGSQSWMIGTDGEVKIDCSEIGKGRIAYGGFSEGIAFLQSDKHFIAFNKEGEPLFEMDGNIHSPMIGGYAVYSVSNKTPSFGVIDSKGDIIIEDGADEYVILPTRNMAHPTQFAIYENYKFLYILDVATGKRYLEGFETSQSYDNPMRMDWNDCIVYYDEDSKKYGLLDKDGNWLIEPTYDYMANDGEWYVIKEDDRIGWCDKTGKYMIEPQFKVAFHAAWSIDKTRFGIDDWAWIGAEACFINRKGEVALELENYPETNFIGDRCLMDGGRKGYFWMDREGNQISEYFNPDKQVIHILRYSSRDFNAPYPRLE